MRALFLSLALTLTATTGMAEQAVPDRHVAISRDVDFPGFDLQNIFDTNLDACQAACLNNTQCQAFTFNQRSNSCFPKSGVAQTAPYQGAISARIYETDPRVLITAPARAGDLSFLDPADLQSALQLARDIGSLHATDENSSADLISAARQAAAAGNSRGAALLTGAAVAVTDLADQWLEYSRYVNRLQGGGENGQLRDRAVSAAINGYLRTLDDPSRATALADLARALETAERGRLMIPALRLAQDIAPGRDTEAALDLAIGKYGFRVQDTQVESESATPRICAVFTENLVKAGVDYTPFVQLPDPKLTVEVNDAQLCIDGVDHGQRYRIVLREGLPSASGGKLVRPVELTFYVRDRSPAVSFASRAYVLPRLGAVAIPVSSVNLDTANLTLRRMTDRNLIRTMQEGLFANPLYDWNTQYFDDQLGEQVWTGTISLGRDLNQDVTTRIPLDEALKGAPAGVYVLSASVPGADPYDKPPATQWFILSDLGLSTILGTDGLTVAVRALGDAAALPGAMVTLASESNEILGTATTDDQGIARFEAGLTRGLGASAPALVTVTQGHDMAFLSLRDAAFDLSDRGVEGREPSGPIDVFLATDRGAYRAGETIHLTALMRDAAARALPGVPLTAILTRPDGVEYSRITSTFDAEGGHVFALPVAANAPRGTWSIAVRSDPKAPALATRSVLVEDFLPERIDFALALPAVIHLGDVPVLSIDARYLFGPKAADLTIEGEAVIRAATDVAGFPGYQFGRYDEPVDPQVSYLDGGTTDADGLATIPVTLPDVVAPGRPLEVLIAARLAEGSGRPVERRITAPVLPDSPMIGIKPASAESVPEGGTALFSLIGLTPDLTPQPMQVQWTLNRVTTRYSWYSLYGNWNWEPVTTRERIATGTATLGTAPVDVGAQVDWGQYELVVERTDGDYVASSVAFYAGWYAPADATTTPDLLEASLDKPAYAIGETAQFRIVPRYAGIALVSVVSNHLIHLEQVPVTEGATVIPLTVTEDWGAGAYVTATVIRPMDVAAGHNPARSLGLAYAPVAPGDKALSVSIAAAAAAPRAPLPVTVRVDGIRQGETAYVTLAAVDLGILNLTAFKSPDPQGYYFGQRKLGVELRDIYGNLIDGLNGAMGVVRSGGDAMAQMKLESPPPTEDLVAYFEGPVTVGPDGTAQASFDLPAFNGTVRLMAVAWSATGVGQAEKDVLVRDPVVVTASVPRFMAPGDQSRMLLEIVHADSPAGQMGLSITADGLALSGQGTPATFTLAQGGKQTFRIPFAAFDPGVHSLTVAVTTPDGAVLTKTVLVPVKANDPELSRQSRFTLAPGDVFDFDRNVFAGLMQGTGSSTLSVGPLARFDAPGLLNALDRYPYGCTEQITSKALPLLYFDQVAQAMGLANRDEVGQRIDQAIVAVLANQDSNGAFGLWGPSSGDLWLDAYVTDFLSRARAAGHAVPDIAFANAIDNLRNRVNYAPDFDSGGEDLAYALMVLAREGAANVGDLRYYADERATAFSTPLGSAQLGAALGFYGDQTRADLLFGQAGRQLASRIGTAESPVWRIDYGTDRRDAAAVLTLAVEAGSTAIDRDSLASRLGNAGQEVSTQEAAWTLLATNALIRDVRTAGITVDGQQPAGPLVRVLDQQTRTAPVRIANTGQTPTELTVTTFGVPTDPEPAGGNGYQIDRSYFAIDGTPVDPAQVAIGTRMVTVLTVTPFGKREARLMVTDPLPAGFEIDNPNLIQGGQIAGLDWLDPVQGEHAEFRSDRFLAAVDWRSDQPFRLGYIVRALSPGAFHHPAASVQDMYRPQLRARTDAGTVTVTE